MVYLNYIFAMNIVIAKVKERNGANTIIAHSEDSVTIMFCDILQFVEMMNFLSPSEFVTTLNEIYSAIDILCDQYYVQKMETVGKTYMV